MSKITCGDFPTISLQVHSKTLKSQHGMTFGRKVDLLLDQIHNQKILSNKSDKIKSLNTEAFWGNNKKIVNTLLPTPFFVHDFLQVFSDFFVRDHHPTKCHMWEFFRNETYTKSFVFELPDFPSKKKLFWGSILPSKIFHFRRCDPGIWKSLKVKFW